MEEDLYDTTLYSCDGKSFKANSKIVCAYSKLISKHFNGEHSNEIEIISPAELRIKEVTSHVLQITLDFIYGVTPKTITNVKLLLIGAKKLEVDNAFEFCKNQISDLYQYYLPSNKPILNNSNEEMISRNSDPESQILTYEIMENPDSLSSLFLKPIPQEGLNGTNMLVNKSNQNDTKMKYNQYETYVPQNIDFYQESESHHNESRNCDEGSTVPDEAVSVYCMDEPYIAQQHVNESISGSKALHNCNENNTGNENNIATEYHQNYQQIRKPPAYSDYSKEELFHNEMIKEVLEIDKVKAYPQYISEEAKRSSNLNIGSLLECLETDGTGLLQLEQMTSSNSAQFQPDHFQSTDISNTNNVYIKNSNQSWHHSRDTESNKDQFTSSNYIQELDDHSLQIPHRTNEEMYNDISVSAAEKKSYYVSSMHAGGECYILDQTNSVNSVYSNFTSMDSTTSTFPVKDESYLTNFTNSTKMQDYNNLQSVNSHGYSYLDNNMANVYDCPLGTQLQESFTDKVQVEYDIPLERNIEIIEHNTYGNHETLTTSIPLNSAYVNEMCADIANTFSSTTKTECFTADKPFDSQQQNTIITNFNSIPLNSNSSTHNESFNSGAGSYYNIKSASGSSLRNSTKKRQKINSIKQPKTSGPHICKECNEMCLTVQALKRHQLKVHKKGQLFPCKKCSFKTPRKKDILSHLLSQHGLVPPNTKIFSCHHCSYRCVDKYRFYEHQATHSGIKSFQCDLCYNSFTTKRGLRNHVLRHSDNRPFQCERCQASFKVKSKLKDHIRLVHLQKGEKPFKCGYCDFHASVRGNVNQHIRNVHKQELIKVIDTKSHQRRFVKKYDYENITGNDIETKDAF